MCLLLYKIVMIYNTTMYYASQQPAQPRPIKYAIQKEVPCNKIEQMIPENKKTKKRNKKKLIFLANRTAVFAKVSMLFQKCCQICCSCKKKKQQQQQTNKSKMSV